MIRTTTFAVSLFLLPTVFAGTLEEDFLAPPMGVRPHVWWHWPGYNVTSNGIARDLKAMHEAGIGGATAFSITSHSGKWCGTPMENTINPDMTYGDEKWWGFLRFAAETAAQYGMEVGMHNCPGFSCSGGPWITPDHAMKKVVWTVCDAPGTPAEPDHGDFGRYREIGTTTANGKIYRFGYVSCNYRTKPCPADIEPRSVECDKMSAEAVKCHLDNVLLPLKAHLGPYLGKSFRHILMDSYEAEHCDWTDGFRETFTARRGYDPLPYLPVFAGADLPGAVRFREDHARTVAELYTENHYRQMHERLAELKLDFHLEPYGGPFDGYEAARYADAPMVEFWMPDVPWQWQNPDGIGGYPGATGASGRAFGRRIVGSEAFTGFPTWAQWSESPRDFKVPGDASYARGINRLTLHEWVHQPFDPKFRPGNTMGYWGSHFGDCQTWYEPGKAWYRYLGRCQALLQRGEQVVDQLALCDAPTASEFDAIAESTLLDGLTVLPNGDLKLPSDRTYRLLRLSQTGLMGAGVVRPAVARRIRELVRAGAAVWAPKRFERAEGLKDRDAADIEVRAVAAELWEKPHPRFFTGTLEEALAALDIVPGFEVIGPNDRRRPVLGTHRAESGADVFFVANLSSNAVCPTLAFRATGRVPEIWNPETTARTDVRYWREDGHRTFLTQPMAPYESFFVVFRKAGRPQAVEEKPLVAGPATELDGHWRVSFEKGLGAPEGEVVLTQLESLSKVEVPGIRFFSGTATYRKKFLFRGPKWLFLTDGTPTDVAKFRAASKRIVLDLGDVRDIAEVSVNGKPMGTLWHPPYAVDVTDALIDDYNTIEVKVTNTWHNRLVGDDREPDDCTWGEGNTENGNFIGRPIRRLPDFLLNATPRPSSNRVCFCVWDYFGVNSPLIPSGLIGPVVLRSLR